MTPFTHGNAPRDNLGIFDLPSASTFVNMFNILTGFTYRGLTPHKLTPMPGVHNRLENGLALRWRFMPAAQPWRWANQLWGRLNEKTCQADIPASICAIVGIIDCTDVPFPMVLLTRHMEKEHFPRLQDTPMPARSPSIPGVDLPA